MEKQLKYVLLLSLKEMALRKVAVLLWSDSDILASISKYRPLCFDYENTLKEWRETVEDKVKNKMLKLWLPESLMKQVIDIVRPISLEIRRWIKIHEAFLWVSRKEIGLPDTARLCWTTAGALDYKRTAEELVRCDKLNVESRYELSCLYCLEDYIPLLWDKLPEEKKEYYYNRTSNFSNLKFCWPHILKGELSKLDYLLRTDDRNLTSFNQWAFEHSVEIGNKTAAEYFFQKLTHEEREVSLMRAAYSVLAEPHPEYIEDQNLSDLLCYLLSLMTPEQQMEAIKTHPVNILFCFLDLPWQDLSLANAGFIWAFLPLSCCYDLLTKMCCRFENSDLYFPKFLQEFFKQSPLGFKKYFLNQESESGYSLVCHFLSIIFTSEDSEIVEVIFRNVDAADRLKLVFHLYVLELFHESILMDRWHMVEVCLREAALSKEDRERLKDAFMRYLNIDEAQLIGREYLKCFFEFLDETDADPDKEEKGLKHKPETCPPE